MIDGTESVAEVRGRRLAALLAALALEAGAVVPVSRLVGAVWGEEIPASPENSLHTLVKRLRAITGRAAVDWVEPGYVLVVEPDAVDAHRFGRSFDAGRRALAEGRAQVAVAELDRMLELWKGPALGDAAQTEVLRAAAEALGEQRLRAVELHADACLELGRAAEVVRGLAAEASAHPFRESLAARLVTALAAAGRPSDALRAFRRIEWMLRTERGVEPSALLRRAVAPLEPPAEPQRAALTGQAPPRRLTSFVGRGAEVCEVAALLRRHRLVTLVGPGGIGKTRLANELVLAHGARLMDGYGFAELSAVAPDLSSTAVRNAVAAAVCAAVAPGVLLEEPGGDWTDALVRVLGRQRMLLILDNCEHVISAVAELAVDLLARLPRLTILATSRQLLAVDCEQLYPVRALPVPTPEASVDGAVACAAVRLFLDRATAVRPDFELSEDNCRAITTVVRTLDGVPLALELAAARLHGLSPQALADRLDDRFDLLANGSRQAAPRHRSLRAMVAWSWALLPTAEAELACRLSVFAGSTTLEAITGVCGADIDDQETVADWLAGLVAMSLVEFDGRRYRMLDTIRTYAADELARVGETERWERAHAAWFVDFCEAGARELRGPAQREWMRRFAADHANCEAALAWSIRHREPEVAVRLFGDLAWYWLFRGRRTHMSTWRSRVLDLTGARIPPGCTGSFLMCRYAEEISAPVIVVRPESIPDTSAEFEHLIRVAMTEPRGIHPFFMLLLALREHYRGDRSLLDRCATAEEGGLRGQALVIRAYEDVDAKPIESIFADLEAAVDCLSDSGDPRTLCAAMLELAQMRVLWHGIDCAAPSISRATELLSDELSPDIWHQVLLVAANLHLCGGDIAGATGYLAGAEKIDPTDLTGAEITNRCQNRAYMAWREGRIDHAFELFENVVSPTLLRTDFHSVTRMFVPARWRAIFAAVSVDADRMDTAVQQLRIAREYAASASPLMLLDVAFAHALAALAADLPEHAARILGAQRRGYRGEGRTVLGPDDQRAVVLARKALGDEAFEKFAGEGEDTALEPLLVEVEHAVVALR
ncbi:ATP-binding protein [Nocardia stercoris]|uniref:ATP-binding protein n=1 Tax=Nocardia stercoris TaxID=2483361 RepID=UPI001319C126|nr:BTAD domain-containing putative transcriptional regulator [Nocardia stercoris]